jgi:hypothetical protein
MPHWYINLIYIYRLAENSYLIKRSDNIKNLVLYKSHYINKWICLKHYLENIISK